MTMPAYEAMRNAASEAELARKFPHLRPRRPPKGIKPPDRDDLAMPPETTPGSVSPLTSVHFHGTAMAR